MKSSRFPFTSFPNGWFCVAYSNELHPGEVQPLYYFGKDLVLFRTEDGTPHVFDAHCPHLGAHLGYGGKVKGENIQCPFHGWCFDGNGKCVDIPYANKIPPKAQIRTWHVREVNGLIMVYYHAQAEAPTWEIPALPEYSSKEWMPFRSAYYKKLRTHVQELGEQFPDIAHIKFLHSDEFVKSNAPTIDDAVWSKFFWTKQSFTTRGVGFKTSTQKVSNSQIETQYKITLYGLGYNEQRYCTKAMFEFHFLVLVLLTPVDEEYVDICLVISAKKLFNSFITAALTSLILKVFKKEFEKDITILEKKLHHPHPILCEGDGEIMQYRRWASQFYAEEPAIAKALIRH